MPMILPDEIAAKSVLPAVRAMIVKRLIEEAKLTQKNAADLLGISQPAISKYLHNKRGATINLAGVKQVELIVGEIVEMISEGVVDRIALMGKIQEAVDIIRRNRYMCELHKKLEPSLDINQCHICDQ